MDQVLAPEGLRQGNCDAMGLRLFELSTGIDLVGMMRSRKEDQMNYSVNVSVETDRSIRIDVA